MPVGINLVDIICHYFTFLLSFCLLFLSVTERGVLKYITIFVDLYVLPLLLSVLLHVFGNFVIIIVMCT